MRKIILPFVLLQSLLLVMPVQARSSFNPGQLDQFNATNQCAGCDLSGAKLNPNHSGATLDNANLSNISCENNHYACGLNFSAASLRQANFSAAELEGSNFSGADLTGAIFYGADLRWANFYGAKGVNLKGARSTCYTTMPDGKFNDCDN